MELKDIRQEIDKVDIALVALIEKRMDLVATVTSYKKRHQLPVLDAQRENYILEKVAGLVTKDLYKETVVQSFTAIMASSRAFQNQFIENDDNERGL
ncbi:chorismate mutase [Streptococcus iniae]|uniref:chorismate mutase n=1 Tax=Streptococcus iniae TaxID=1346 RepID=UPI002B2ABA00|nr:chorismate mutase [Streptococcus iniae]WNZ95460.1 chorismate mutase [Streptococcus iniae]